MKSYGRQRELQGELDDAEQRSTPFIPFLQISFVIVGRKRLTFSKENARLDKGGGKEHEL